MGLVADIGTQTTLDWGSPHGSDLGRVGEDPPVEAAKPTRF